jgi:hypothetical protein
MKYKIKHQRKNKAAAAKEVRKNEEFNFKEQLKAVFTDISKKH